MIWQCSKKLLPLHATQKALQPPFFFFFFFLLFLLLVIAFGQTAVFYKRLIIHYPGRMGTRSKACHWTYQKEICVTNVFQDVTCDACGPCHAMCFFLSRVTSIHSIHKITKIRNSETLNRMEDDTEDSTVQDSKL